MDVGNWIALAGVAVSLLVSALALKHSGDANELARESNGIAQAAEARSDRLERRDTERNDVVWQTDLIGDEWTLTNLGQDTAHNVTWVAVINDTRYTEELDQVATDERVSIEIADAVRASRESYQVTVRSMSEAGIAYGGSPKIRVSERIMWETASGRPCSEPHDVRSIGV